jgi:alpha,alpha-trehalose phosphorylase
VWGIAGIRPTRQALQLDPRLPPGWSGLEIPVRYRGARVRIRIEPDAATIETDRPLRVRLASDRSSSVPPGITRMLLARARRRRTGA